jgi:hypothetical protein
MKGSQAVPGIELDIQTQMIKMYRSSAIGWPVNLGIASPCRSDFWVLGIINIGNAYWILQKKQEQEARHPASLEAALIIRYTYQRFRSAV